MNAPSRPKNKWDRLAAALALAELGGGVLAILFVLWVWAEVSEPHFDDMFGVGTAMILSGSVSAAVLLVCGALLRRESRWRWAPQMLVLALPAGVAALMH